MIAEALTCRELVTDYLEGALSPEDTRRFEAHIGACDNCSAYLDQLRRTIRLTGSLREEQLSPEMREELLHAFREWRVVP